MDQRPAAAPLLTPRLAGSGPQKVSNMSICSQIKSALRRRGLIFKFVRPADAERIGELVDLICQRNQDGSALRYALRHWRSGERPVVERFAGHDTSLEVEGPCFLNDGRGYRRVAAAVIPALGCRQHRRRSSAPGYSADVAKNWFIAWS